MALTGQAKADYQREFMRSNATAGPPSPCAAFAGKNGAAIACSLATRTPSSASSASPWPSPMIAKARGR